MPIDNAFRHQPYCDPPRRADYQLLPAPLPGSQFDTQAPVSECPLRKDVDRVILVHGTFTGDDALGLIRSVERMWPGAGDWIRQLSRAWVDNLAGDVGNYTAEYVQQFVRLMGPTAAHVDVERFTWSGENHHVGRADAAIRLADELLQGVTRERRRCLLWGHSHAGNVFALVTNLLAGPPLAVRKFFSACRPLFASKQVSDEDRERWERVRYCLVHRPEVAQAVQLDIVTFGTPIRYGWETRGYRRLLHFVHHRPADGQPAYRAPFPPSWEDVRWARHGDVIQQLGIAGTDFIPSLFTWRAFRVQKRLNKLLQRGLHRSLLWQRLKLGVRVADEGMVRLIDYPDDASHQREQLCGHAIYTGVDWLAYHLEQVTESFYRTS